MAEHGEPLIDDPERVGQVRELGVAETTWLSATNDHATPFAKGLVDLERRIVVDVVPGNSAADLGAWLDRQPTPWLDGVRVVATDLAESYRAALDGRLDHALRVAHPFTSSGSPIPLPDCDVAWTRKRLTRGKWLVRLRHCPVCARLGGVLALAALVCGALARAELRRSRPEPTHAR